LDSWLRALGIPRDRVFITNICTSRPLKNRDPLPAEIETCSPFLVQQIRIIKPNVIYALGRVAAQFLSKSPASPSTRDLRSRVLVYRDGDLWINLKAVYHPSYVMRQERGGDTNINDQAILDMAEGLKQQADRAAGL